MMPTPTETLILFLDTTILLIATGICRYSRHDSFWALIVPLTLIVTFMYMVASDLDTITHISFMGSFGDYPTRSIVWRSMLVTGLFLRLMDGRLKLRG